MLRGTTPTVEITLPNTYDLTGVTTIYMSFEQKKRNILDLSANRLTINANKISATLTQEETLLFKDSVTAYTQLRWLQSGVAYGTKKAVINIDGIIKDGVIS